MLQWKQLVVLCLGFLAACGGPAGEGESRPERLAQVGQGLAGEINPTALDFGAQRVDTQSAPRVVKLFNRGTTAFSVTSLTVSGPFAVTPGDAFTLPPGTSRDLQVVFRPTAAESAAGTLVVKTTDADNPEHLVSLAGTGIRPMLSVSPSSVDFGEQRVGAGAPSRTVTLRNTGSASVKLTSFSIGAPFQLLGAPTAPVTLEPNSEVSFAVAFKPTQQGTFVGKLELTTEDPDYVSISVALVGKGTQPQLIVTPETLEFGTLPVNTTRSTELTVRNVGTANARVTSITLSGPGAGAFSVPATEFELPPASSRNLTVTFTPAAPGAFAATLTFKTEDSAVSASVSLNGSSVKPQLAVSMTALDFGEQRVGTSGGLLNLGLRNVGTGDLKVTDLTLSGPQASAFTHDGSLPLLLAAGESRFVRVKFNPTSAGSARATLDIHSNDAEKPLISVSMSGRGVAPSLSLSTTTLAFGAQRVGVSSSPQNVTVKNVGSSPLHITRVIFSQSAFSATTSLPIEVAPGGSHILPVFFFPTAPGAVTAEMTVMSDDSQSPNTVSLYGTGVDSVLAVDATSVDFGPQRVGTPVTRSVTVSNTGSGPLNITAVSVTADTPFSVTPNGALELPPGTSRVLTVTFTPPADGPFTAKLQVDSNASQSPRSTVDLAGSGVSSTFVLGPTSLDFGAQTVGTSSAVRKTTVHNTGRTPLRVTSMALSSAAPFSTAPSAPFELAPGASQDVSVTFSPTAVGAVSATLTVITDASSMPEASVSLAGTGEAVKTAPEEDDQDEEEVRGCASTGGSGVGAGLLALLALMASRPRRQRV